MVASNSLAFSTSVHTGLYGMYVRERELPGVAVSTGFLELGEADVDAP